MQEIIWGQNAGEGDMYAPDTDKQKQGWGKEQPPYQVMNWLQHRTDARLNDLEAPWTYRRVTDKEHDEYASNSEYEVPEYITGTDSLQVYLGDVLAGKGESYDEVGSSDGIVSTSIRWKQAIPENLPISVYVKQYADEPMITVPLYQLEELTAECNELYEALENLATDDGLIARLIEEVGAHYGLDAVQQQ